MNPTANWIRLAFACVLGVWLPAASAAQPLVYVASDSVSQAPTRVAQLTVVNSATGHAVKTLTLGEWIPSSGAVPCNPAVVSVSPSNCLVAAA